MFKKLAFSLVTVAVLLPTVAAQAAINVLACEPEWGALVTELAQDKAQVYIAVTALQDVHHIQARPSLIATTRNADLIVCTGAELEVGWLPVLVRESGNTKIQPGSSGYFEAAQYVTLMNVPTVLDRREGDVHPAGNPHLQTDPHNIATVAEALSQQLATVDAANADFYKQRYQAFADRWQKAIAQWETRAAPLRGLKVVEHHDAFAYLFNWLGIEAVGFLEPKPGMEPTSGHMSELLQQQKDHPAKVVVRTSYNDPRASEWFSERAKIPTVALPIGPGSDDASKDLYAWYDDMLDLLVKVAK